MLTIDRLVVRAVVAKPFSRPAVQMPWRVIDHDCLGAEGRDGGDCWKRSLTFERHGLWRAGYEATYLTRGIVPAGEKHYIAIGQPQREQ